MYYRNILCSPTENLKDFPKPREMLHEHVLSVEGWRHVSAHDDGEVSRRQAAQAIHAVPVSTSTHRGHHRGHHLGFWTLSYT